MEESKEHSGAGVCFAAPGWPSPCLPRAIRKVLVTPFTEPIIYTVLLPFLEVASPVSLPTISDSWVWPLDPTGIPSVCILN